MTKSEKASKYFQNGFNCSQSVFTVLATELGLKEDEALKIACAFGGGMGRQQLTCGAVTGALMALGLKYGKGKNDEEIKKKETYSKTVEFINEFKKLHGSVNCKELLNNLNMTDDEDYKKMLNLNIFEIKCNTYVVDAIRIWEKIT